MQIARDKDQLIVRSENAQGCGGLVGVVVGIVILSLASRLNVGTEDLWIVLLVGSGFLAMGINFLLPRRITVIFDLSSRQVHHTATLWKTWRVRTRTVPFSAISSIGFDQPDSTELTYWPVLRLDGGESLYLSINPAYGTGFGSDPTFGGSLSEIETIADATGLRMRNAD